MIAPVTGWCCRRSAGSTWRSQRDMMSLENSESSGRETWSLWSGIELQDTSRPTCWPAASAARCLAAAAVRSPTRRCRLLPRAGSRTGPARQQQHIQDVGRSRVLHGCMTLKAAATLLLPDAAVRGAMHGRRFNIQLTSPNIATGQPVAKALHPHLDAGLDDRRASAQCHCGGLARRPHEVPELLRAVHVHRPHR